MKRQLFWKLCIVIAVGSVLRIGQTVVELQR